MVDTTPPVAGELTCGPDNHMVRFFKESLPTNVFVCVIIKGIHVPLVFAVLQHNIKWYTDYYTNIIHRQPLN